MLPSAPFVTSQAAPLSAFAPTQHLREARSSSLPSHEPACHFRPCWGPTTHPQLTRAQVDTASKVPYRVSTWGHPPEGGCFCQREAAPVWPGTSWPGLAGRTARCRQGGPAPATRLPEAPAPGPGAWTLGSCPRKQHQSSAHARLPRALWDRPRLSEEGLPDGASCRRRQAPQLK